jgi:uncharacterized membrane protein YeaQ/YmgE (transglycosylase-associated protein family)
MNILVTILVGLIVGLLARFAMPGRDPMGFILTTLLGIAGAFLGAWIGQATGVYAPGEPAGWIISIIGACIVLVIARQFRKAQLH